MDELRTAIDSQKNEVSQRSETFIQQQAELQCSFEDKEALIEGNVAMRSGLLEIYRILKEHTGDNQECDAAFQALSARVEVLKGLRDSVRAIIMVKVDEMRLEEENMRKRIKVKEDKMRSEVDAKRAENVEFKKKFEELSKEAEDNRARNAEKNRLIEMRDRLKLKLLEVTTNRRILDEQIAARVHQEEEEVEHLRLVIADLQDKYTD